MEIKVESFHLQTVRFCNCFLEPSRAVLCSIYFSRFTDLVAASSDRTWMSRAFCTQPQYRACAAPNITALEQMCKSRGYVVSKDIVVSSLQMMSKFSRADGPSVLHLVRDPRAILSSRIRIKDKGQYKPQVFHLQEMK